MNTRMREQGLGVRAFSSLWTRIGAMNRGARWGSKVAEPSRLSRFGRPQRCFCGETPQPLSSGSWVVRWSLATGFGWRWGWLLGWMIWLAVGSAVLAGERIVLATYNVENYLLNPSPTRKAKSEDSKAKVVEVLKRVGADIVGLQEIGGKGALDDLQRRLKRVGLDYGYQEWVQGFDTNIQVALLSRHPIVRRRPHVEDSYLLSGKRFRVSRGFLEADIRVGEGYQLTVWVAHLKSRRTSVEADEAEMRKAEARLLREKVEARLREYPKANLVVRGDLNDTHDSTTVRGLLGRGKEAWVDTRPYERQGDTGYTPQARWKPRTVSWTHFYGVEDTYSRVDYVLLHPNAAREWRAGESYVPVVPDWGQASDHRPVVVVLEAVDR